MAMSEANTKVFESMGKTLENATQTFVGETVSDLIATISPWVLGGISLYIVLYGYLVIFDKINAPFKDGMIKMGKIVFISGIALTSGNYMDYIVGLLTGIQDGLATAFSGSDGVGRTTIYAALDGSLSKGLELILDCREQAIQAGSMQWGVAFGWWVIAAIVAAGIFLVVVLGGITLLMSTMYLKILFAIGPFFVASLLFPMTRRFFDSWVGYVFNHMLVVSLTAVVLSFGISIYDHEVSKVIVGSNQNMLLVSLELLIVAGIMYAITKGIVNMAAALAGGLTMSVMSIGGLVGNAMRGGRQASEAARTALEAAKAVKTGGLSLGKTALDATSSMAKRFGGNSVKQGSWQPAFRRHTIDAINKGGR